MITLLRRFWDGFLNNEAYFIARVRAAVMLGAMLGVAEAHRIVEALDLPPGAAPWIQRVGVFCTALSMLMRAGDKTPENLKSLSHEMSPAGDIPVAKIEVKP